MPNANAIASDTVNNEPKTAKAKLDIEGYLQQHFIAGDKQKLKMCLLWGSDRVKYFRLNMYTYIKREGSIMDFVDITQSWFVIVTIDSGALSHVIDYDKKTL